MDNTAARIPNFTRSRFLLHIVFASTSGHTEYVVDSLIDSLKDIAPGWEIEKTMAETTQPQDLLRGDVLLLASATWNTRRIDGQLNPYMSLFLQDNAKNLDWRRSRARPSGSATVDISTQLGRRIIWSSARRR